MTVPIATIDQALEVFLAAQRERLSERTFRDYEYVAELLRGSLNGYAYDTLGADDRARWEAAFEAGDEGAYCHLFGPDHIPAHLGRFLGYFMIRKVMAGEELLRASGTVTKRLAKWLRDEGLISAEQAADAADRGPAATRDCRGRSALATSSTRGPRSFPTSIPPTSPTSTSSRTTSRSSASSREHSGLRAVSAQSRFRRRRAISPSQAGASTSSW